MRVIVILVLLACVAYANSLYAPFVFDDLTSIQHNRAVRFFYLDSVKELLNTRSLLNLTYAFNEWLDGENVFGYHVVNLLLHILNGLLVFAMAKWIFERLNPPPSDPRMYALVAAAFFLIHPVQTEAVTYITERSELLSKMMCLCGLFVFMRASEKKAGVLASVLVFLCLVLGLGFKETAIMLPAAIVLYDYIFLSKGSVRNMLVRWRFYAGLFTLMAAASYFVLDALRRPLNEVGIPGTLRPWYYFLTSLRAIARYIRLIVFPTGLNLDYDFPPVASIQQPAALLSIGLIAGLLIMAWRWRRRRPVFAFSIFWFFIALAPTAGIIPIPDVIFEHRLYLALAGVCLSFPFVLQCITLKPRRVVAFASVILGVLMVGTIFRNYVWADELRLFSDVVAKSPHKLRAYENLIFAHMKRGEEDKALAVAKEGLEKVPESRLSLLDTIGNLYLRQGNAADAVANFKKSNEEAGRSGASAAFLATSYNNLGVAYLALARTIEPGNPKSRNETLRSASEAFQKSLEREINVGVLDSLVNVRQQLGEAAALEQELRKNLAANPRDFMSIYKLGSLLSLEDRYTEAIEYFSQAVQQQSLSEVLYFNYAFALAKTGQRDRAIEEYIKALRLDPLFHEAHYNLALLYIDRADYSSAVQHLQSIVSVEAADVRANLKLAQIYAGQGKLPQAKQHLQQVLKVSPRDREALSLFARIGG